MKKVIGFLLVMFINSFFLLSAFAEDAKTALVPLPSVDDFTKGHDGWSFGLGLGVEYESAYEGSDEFGFEAQPAGAVQWRSGDDIFYWAGEALGWRGLRSDTWLLDVAVAFDEGREESDSDDGHLDGLGDEDEETELVLQARYALDDDWRYWLALVSKTMVPARRLILLVFFTIVSMPTKILVLLHHSLRHRG